MTVEPNEKNGIGISGSDVIRNLLELARSHSAVSIHRHGSELIKTIDDLTKIGLTMELAEAAHGSKAKCPTFKCPDELNRIVFKRCAACNSKYDPDEIGTEEICVRCGGELAELPEKRDLLKEPKRIADAAYQHLLRHCYIVYLDDDEEARKEDRTHIKFVTTSQLTEPVTYNIGARTITVPPLDQVMRGYVRKFTLAKNRILQNYDRILQHTLAYYTRIILTAVTASLDDEQMWTLAEEVAQQYIDSTSRNPITGTATDFELPARLEGLSLQVHDIIRTGNEDLLADHPPNRIPPETLKSAVKSTLIRTMNYFMRYIPSRDEIDRKFGIRWHITTFSLPVGVLPDYGKQISKKEAQIRRLQLETDFAEGMAQKEEAILKANSELALMKRVQEDSLRQTHRQQLDIVKAKYTQVMRFLESEFGRIYANLMSKDTITIKNLPRTGTIERIVQNLQFYNSAIGSDKLNEISQNILALVEDARESEEEDQEDRMQELVSYLGVMVDSIANTSGIISREIDSPDEQEMRRLIEDIVTDSTVIAEREVAAEEGEEELEIPAINDNTIDDERI